MCKLYSLLVDLNPFKPECVQVKFYFSDDRNQYKATILSTVANHFDNKNTFGIISTRGTF